MGDGDSGMKRCPQCAEDIKAEAVKCRYCGSDLRAAMRPAVQQPQQPQVVHVQVRPGGISFMKLIKGAILLMVFAILATVIGMYVVCTKSVKDEADRTKEQSEAEDPRVVPSVRAVAGEPSIEISAADLEAAYRANEVDADNRYQGKVLRVSGVVERILKGDLGDPRVVLRSQRVLAGVMCVFDTDSSTDVGRLTKGQRVVLRGVSGRGTVDGKTIGNPVMWHCVIEAIMGPACRVPNAKEYGGRTVSGECKPKPCAGDFTGFYEGYCQGASNIVCCVK